MQQNEVLTRLLQLTLEERLARRAEGCNVLNGTIREPVGSRRAQNRLNRIKRQVRQMHVLVSSTVRTSASRPVRSMNT